MLDDAFANALDPVERILEIMFICHVIVEMRTAFIDLEEKKLVVDARSIAIRYMDPRNLFGTVKEGGGWFCTDVLACLPIHWLFADPQSGEANASGGMRLARLARLGRLMRVATLVRKRMSSNWMWLGKLSFYVMISAHWFGCLWFVSSAESSQTLPQPFVQMIRCPELMLHAVHRQD